MGATARVQGGNVKAVIFDYGGVLCKLPTSAQTQELANECGLSEELFLQYFWQFRLSYDRGDLDRNQYWRSIARAAGRTYAEEQIDIFDTLDVRFWLKLDEPMLEWNRTLRAAGFKTAILSNMPESLGVHLYQHSNLFGEFDTVTLSYEVRSAKPESKIYRSCLAHLGFKAGEALFLDDKVTNVRAAQAVGLHAITYKDREQLAGKEKQYGLPDVPTTP